MGFLYPVYLWLLVPLLVGVGLWALSARRSAQVLPRWFAGRLGFHLPWLKFGLRAGGLLLVVLGAAGPHFGFQTLEEQLLGRQVYFLMDVSASMQVDDVPPTRLQAAKEAVSQVAEQLRGDQLGLIVYTDYGFPQCPLTTDYEAFKLFLDLASSQQFANTGSNVREGLRQLLARFAQAAQHQQYQVARVAVLLTDGEHFGSNYQSVINRLEDMGVRLVPVVVGTERGGTVPKFGPDGERDGTYRTADGGVAISRADGAPLNDMAQQFGTRLFTLNSRSFNSQALASYIQGLPAGVIASEEVRKAADRSLYFLLPGFLLLLASLFILPKAKGAATTPPAPEPAA